MNDYALMEDFLNKIKRFALENPDKNISEDFIYSLLMRYNIPKNQKPLENITAKFKDLYVYFKNTRNIHLFEVPNFNFLIFENGHLNGSEIKLYAPYDGKHIVEAAKKIFDFMASKNISHQSKIAYICRNDDLVIRVNTLEDANQIISFIKNDSFLNNNLLNVNPFLPNNGGIGMAMDYKLSFNSVLCEMISDFVLLLKKENRLQDLNVQNLNIYIKNRIPNIPNLDKRDICKILSGTTAKGYTIENFYAHAIEKVKDAYGYNREMLTTSNFHLEMSVKITEKYHPGFGIPALKNYINGGISIGFTRQENARANLIKYVPQKSVMTLIKQYLNTQNISYSSFDEAISKYVDSILGRNVSKISNNPVNNSDGEKIVKNPSQYLEEAVRITEKYHPGFGIPAIIQYAYESASHGFTRKEGARENLINNVPPIIVMSLIEEYLRKNNIAYSNNVEAIRLYVTSILTLEKANIDNNLNNDEVNENPLNLDSIIDVIKNAYIATKNKYNISQSNVALYHLLTDGDLHYFTNQYKDRDNLIKIAKQYDLKKCIMLYFGEEYAYAPIDEIVAKMSEICSGRGL